MVILTKLEKLVSLCYIFFWKHEKLSLDELRERSENRNC